MDVLVNRGQGTKQFASEPRESDLCPSPKKKKVSDCQPTNNQDKAGSSCVPHFIKQSDCFKANDNPLINDSLLNHLGTFSMQELHTGAAPSTSATDNAASRKRKPDDTEGKAYIKKPLNAFMLFKAEQRQNVADELQITNSAKVNVVLGQRWNMMSEQEQAPYFDQARRERRTHEAKYPGWSYKDNYKQSDSFQANDNPLINDSLLNHLGTFNRQGLHTVAAPSTSATDNAASRKRKPDDMEGKAYIKKPLNAFMLFKAEQRQNVADELHTTDSAKVNVVLGQRWKMMSELEQAPYFDKARREKRAHEAKYPGWSYKDNYGKKPKRTKPDKIPVPPNHHHFTFPVAPVNQQPVMAWNAAPPMSFPNQALNNQAHSYHTSHSQNNQKTIIINGIPVQATPIEAFLVDCGHSSNLQRRRSC